MEPNKKGLAIDISLLAIIIALHMTDKDKNLELVVMALLLTHLVVTMSGIHIPGLSDENKTETVGVSKLDKNVTTGGKSTDNSAGTTRGEVITTRETSKLDLNDEFEFVPRKRSSSDGQLGQAEINLPKKAPQKEEPLFRKSVSDSGFRRAFSVPKQTSQTSVDVLLPSSGTEANAKIADARTSFFDKIFKDTKDA